MAIRLGVVAALLVACGALMAGVDAHLHHDVVVKEELQFSPEVWMQALTATLLISAAPVFILLLIPVHNAAQNKPLLNILLAFAMGGLLGDVFLHLLPHSFAPHDHAHEHESAHAHEHHAHEHEHHHEHEAHHHEHEAHHHEHEAHHHEHEHAAEHGAHSLEGVMTGLWIIVGIFAFLIVEKTIRNLTGGHGHSHAAPKAHQSPPTSPKKAKKAKKASKNAQTAVKSHEHVSRVSGFLNLAADFTHNFTDGLAIGATFVAGERMGMITTVAILLHEVPHEIGDFAILVHSGFTKWQAMKLQFLTAIGALLGTAVGLMTGGLASATNVILPVTAGGFIYISTVSVIPELLEDSSSFVQTILELLAACVGVSFMMVIALLE